MPRRKKPTRFRRELSSEKLAYFKSKVNELKLIQSMLQSNEIAAPTASMRLSAVQTALFQLSRSR